MSIISELVRGLVEGIGDVLNKPPSAKPWRWGHSYVPATGSTCIYCKRLISPPRQDTIPACQGPSHRLTPAELGR